MRKIKPVQRLPNCYQIKRMRRQPRRLCRTTNTAKPRILRDQRFASHPHFLIGLNRNHFEAASQKYFRKQPVPAAISAIVESAVNPHSDSSSATTASGY
jgi:hypothetical protein